MLSERITTQIQEISKSQFGQEKCDILRKVCFADVCGIRLSISRLIENKPTQYACDFNELLKSLDAEFLINIDVGDRFVEGLHPVRSMHINERLHEFIPIDSTALSVMKIANKEDLPLLFSNFTKFVFKRDSFFDDMVNVLWNGSDLSVCTAAIKGLYSGSVLQYYHNNKALFDDANEHGGLYFISTEKCPFMHFSEFNESFSIIDSISEIFPDNNNINYCRDLNDRIPNINLHDMYIYTFCECLYKKMVSISFEDIIDMTSYATIVEWIYNIDNSFNLLTTLSLDSIWNKVDAISLEGIASLMYTSFCGNNDNYMQFVKQNIDSILRYLKQQTYSQIVYYDELLNSINVKYVLRLSEIDKSNDESVKRLKYFCKTLPIFETYCADAIMPEISFLSAYEIPDDAHKVIPIKNIIIMFHQEFNSIWNKTIMSNYEFNTESEWLNYWFEVRQSICAFSQKSCDCIIRILGKKPLGNLTKELDGSFTQYLDNISAEHRYPMEDRPFKEGAYTPKEFNSIKNNYFASIRNFVNQFAGFLLNTDNNQQLACYNVTMANSNLIEMQDYFSPIAEKTNIVNKHRELCNIEARVLLQLKMCCDYYKAHSPNNYFNKFQIKRWYESKEKEKRQNAEYLLGPLSAEFNVHYPEDIYVLGNLTYYPIICEDVDISSEYVLDELYRCCAFFADAEYDYLVLILTDVDYQGNSGAFQMPRHTLVDAKNAFDNNDEAFIDAIQLPYVTNVTKQMMNCFCEEYGVTYLEEYNLETSPVSDIAEELWVYSKIRELLIEPEDLEYLTTFSKQVKTKIEKLIDDLDDSIPTDLQAQITNMCNDVFEGEVFGDIELNDFLESTIEY